jgi:hypothetical protein
MAKREEFEYGIWDGRNANYSVLITVDYIHVPKWYTVIRKDGVPCIN